MAHFGVFLAHMYGPCRNPMKDPQQSVQVNSRRKRMCPDRSYFPTNLYAKMGRFFPPKFPLGKKWRLKQNPWVSPRSFCKCRSCTLVWLWGSEKAIPHPPHLEDSCCSPLVNQKLPLWFFPQTHNVHQTKMLASTPNFLLSPKCL